MSTQSQQCNLRPEKISRMIKQTIKERNNTAVEMEFLLISVIQGLALQFLVSAAVTPFEQLQFEYWLYIASGFLLILIFWTQAIVHALSFIQWPINLTHTFLYFLVSFVEVLVFYQVGSPFRWFMFGSVFLFVASILYAYDLYMIRKRQKTFAHSDRRNRLYEHLYRTQKRELTFYAPAALIFSLLSAAMIYQYPEIFIDNHAHLFLSGLQTLFSIILLAITAKNFNKRMELL